MNNGRELMGLDLRLLPMEASMGDPGPPVRLRGEIFFSHSILSCERRRDLFHTILQSVENVQLPVPRGFSTFLSHDGDYEEYHYGETIETPYGEALMWVPAEALTRLILHVGVRDNPTNRSIWAYLMHQPQYLPIALYWH